MNPVHPTHRIPTRRRSGGTSRAEPLLAFLGWLSALLVVGGLVIALGPLTGPAVAAEAPRGRETPVRGAADLAGHGAALYLNSCSACHGPNGEGTAAGPSLVDVGAASVDFYLRTGRMPLGSPKQRPVRQEPAFGDADIKALVDYVASFGNGPAIPQVRGGGDASRGFELYTATCAACHAATGAGNAVGGGFAAVGLGQATDQEMAEAMTIGPGVMPPFDFTQEQRDDIIAYIKFMRSASSPGGAPIGGTGPVAEGFVAVVIGLTGLVLIARFAGSRRGELDAAEPASASARGTEGGDADAADDMTS
jgi:ubiquinol-cytochrome c reductase cytochrome c subunit